MSDKSIIGGVVVLLLAAGGVLFAVSGGTTSSGKGGSDVPVDTTSPVAQFAQCLKDSGTIFYGAFWCPHCQSQKRLFGDAEKLLPYVECSTPDGNAQTQICIAKGIKSYPTWVFPSGEQLTGERQFTELAEKSGCPMPGEAAQVVSQPEAASPANEGGVEVTSGTPAPLPTTPL